MNRTSLGLFIFDSDRVFASNAHLIKQIHTQQSLFKLTPPTKTALKKQHSFKLYKRGNQLKNSIMISPLVPRIVPNSSKFNNSPRNQDILSSSLLNLPKLVLSLVTPLNENPYYKSSASVASLASEEDKVIAEKRFYLHPSPITTPRELEPQLLPLFLVSLPCASGTSS